MTGATLRVFVTDRTSANGRSASSEWYNVANWPIDAGDYGQRCDHGACGHLITSLSENVQNNLALQSLDLISKMEPTALRLHVNGGAPNGENNVFFASLENPNSNRPEPQLIVTYTTTSGPALPSTRRRRR